jgi:hypothetical protein
MCKFSARTNAMRDLNLLWLWLLVFLAASMPAQAAEPQSSEPQSTKQPSSAPLSIEWQDNYLTVHGDRLPGGKVVIHYLEAYCRPGSTTREWHKTVIGHRTQQLAANEAKTQITLRDSLADGVIVDHVITAGSDEVDFRLTARNPTDKVSEAHWAQPCMRVDEFTGCGKRDALSLVPKYARQAFIFVDGKQAMLPTSPWAKDARYTPGQVYCPRGVDRDDVNPRPLSELVPSHGLIGCYSADKRQILAIAWEPYQELFQGVIACIHTDFRIGGLAPGQSKTIRGKLYLLDADIAKLLARYERNFEPSERER